MTRIDQYPLFNKARMRTPFESQDKEIRGDDEGQKQVIVSLRFMPVLHPLEKRPQTPSNETGRLPFRLKLMLGWE
jgi:hypothetical protein